MHIPNVIEEEPKGQVQLEHQTRSSTTSLSQICREIIKEHLAKGQRMLAGDGMSQVTKTLLDLTQRKNFYAGDLLMSVEILRNVTDTFKRASYIPASDGVQASGVPSSSEIPSSSMSACHNSSSILISLSELQTTPTSI
ncbi:hypothetical protein P7K49_008187 [Saguinus oedipus]|uniref:AGRL2-4 GAIN subdomain A domain-containing protein n=1 Tax=Saguinus oedipus TaxID=9490 RepID=A0ABQ9VX03_SAGOE|nr:hypothetical protein P7K49_008187 [Saguinus oedipus]